MQADIRTYLATVPEVTALIGADPVKLFMGDVPEQMNNSAGVPTLIEKPYAQLEWAGGSPQEALTGHTGVCEVYFQLTAVAKSSPVAKAVYDALYNALGKANYDLWGNLFVQRSTIGLPTDVSRPPTVGNESSLKMFAGRLFIRANYVP